MAYVNVLQWCDKEWKKRKGMLQMIMKDVATWTIENIQMSWPIISIYSLNKRNGIDEGEIKLS